MNPDKDLDKNSAEFSPEASVACPCRRHVLGAGLGVAALLSAGRVLADEEADPAREKRPEKGDLFSFAESDKEGQVITPADLKPGGPQVVAWPYDPVKKVPRDASRLNQVLLVRLDPASLGEETKPRAADGIVAYSAVCTHAGCTVTSWRPEQKWFLCPCHESQYDAAHGAKVMFGPAPRALAALPLVINGGRLEAAGGFIGKVGFAPMG